jgi:hypothetical protein
MTYADYMLMWLIYMSRELPLVSHTNISIENFSAQIAGHVPTTICV